MRTLVDPAVEAGTHRSSTVKKERLGEAGDEGAAHELRPTSVILHRRFGDLKVARDCYDAVGVPRNADDSDLQQAYCRLASTNHPDVNRDPAPEELMIPPALTLREREPFAELADVSGFHRRRAGLTSGGREPGRKAGTR
ncbi:DnaJ domain-containing protein [Pseudonocardia dioxanivorans]|uniref:DnaJ domain-containing protein n=1 Tax=Pseudonocardia dioxanivorans TaxID=240495 RepID=UPI001F2E0795|nr:DnaJ domain-containing protein [Pseudonocardia dioxanivorans]